MWDFVWPFLQQSNEPRELLSYAFEIGFERLIEGEQIKRLHLCAAYKLASRRFDQDPSICLNKALDIG